MASYLPPTENLPTFNPSVFDAGEEALTYDKASKLFLKYPTAQGTETLIDVNVAGTAEIDTLNVLNTSEFQGDTIINNGENRLKINGDTNFVIIDVNNTTAQNLIVGTEYSTNGFISGYQACRDSIQVNDSIIIGYDSCANLNNYTEGDIKGFKNTTAIGKGTLSQISSKWDNDANTALGCEAGNTIQNGSYNVFVGRSAGATDGPPNEVQILEANNCSFIGSNTGVEFDNVVYNNSTALGYGAIITDNNQIQLGTVDEYVNIPNYIKFPDGTTQNTAGGGGGGSGVNTSNTLTGHPYTSAGTGSGSTIGGAFVGTGLTAFGVNSLSNVVFGENNCAVGSYSGHNILDGNYNTLTGENSGLNITYGSSNTCLGYNSGASIVSNNDNTLIGSNTNVSSTLINSSTALGINAIANESGQIQLGTTSNYVNIPNTLKLTNNVPSATTNKNIIDNSSITLTGTASQINVITPTFYSITNSADNTSTLTPTELSVFNSDNFQTVNKGVLSSTDLTITGATASDTNIKNSSSDTITNGTAIASMALVSNVPTITEITSTTGTSSYLTPGSLALYNNDSAKTINNSILTNSALNFKGTTSSYISSLDIDKSIIGDSTNDRFVSNGISYNSSGNSVNYIGPYVYCGTTSPTAPADATNALLLTKENICVYNSNSSRSTNRSLLSSNSLSITGSSSTNTNTKNSSSDTITNGTASIQSALLSSVPTLTAKTSSTGTSSYLTPASLSLYTNNNNTTTNKSVLTQSGLTTTGIDTNTFGIYGTASQIRDNDYESYISPGYEKLSYNLYTNAYFSEQYPDSYSIYGASLTEYSRLDKQSLIINNSSYTTSVSPSSINVQGTSNTTNKTQITPTQVIVIGSTSTSTNIKNATSDTITNGTASIQSALLSSVPTLTAKTSSTGTSSYLTPGQLVVYNADNAQTINKGTLSNSALTMTGSTTTTTNIKSATSDIITDGTGTVSSGIFSGIATLKTLASSGGGSAVITPTTIGIYNADGTTSTNSTEITKSQIAITGSGTTTGSALTTSQLRILNAGLGLYATASSIYLQGSGSVGPSLNRDANTTKFAIESYANTTFTPLTTLGGQMRLYNASTTSTYSNPVVYEISGATSNNMIIGSHHYFALDSASARKEYARQNVVVKDITAGSIDSSIDFSVNNNGTLKTAFQINGLDNLINANVPLLVDTSAGAGTTSTKIDTTNCLLSDTTNSRYALLTSGGYASTGNSINNTGQVLYMGATAPSSAATATPGMILTPTILTLFQNNTDRTNNSVNLSATQGYRASAGALSCRLDPNSFTNPLNITTDNINSFSNTVNTGLFSSSSTATGSSGSVGISFVRTKATTTTGILAGDMIGNFSYWGNAGNSITPNNVEFARQSVSVKNVGTGNNDGSVLFQTSVNGTLTNILELNGDENQINALQPIDMNNNSVVSSTGNITIDASGSSGTGTINLTTKNGTAGSGAGLVLTGNTLTSATSSGSSGQHLAITINGVVYKIALLNA